MLYFDHESRLRLCEERADRLAQDYRRAQRLPRRGPRPARRALSLARLPRRDSAPA